MGCRRQHCRDHACLRGAVLAEAFGFTPVSFAEYVIAMGIGMLGMVIVEIVKTFQRRAMRKRGEIL